MKRINLLNLIIVLFCVSCTKIIDPVGTSEPTVDGGTTERTNPTASNPFNSPYITNEMVVTSVSTNSVPLGEGMFYIQLTHALEPALNDESDYANAIVLIRSSLRAGNGGIEIENTAAKQDIMQGSNIVKTIPYSKSVYRLVQSGARTVLMDYDYTRGATISHNALAMSFFDEYYLRSVTFRNGIDQNTHYSSLSVINSYTPYANIVQVLKEGVEGILLLSEHIGQLSLWQAIQQGRLAIITGDVSEQVAISDDQIQSVPVMFSNYSVSIQFYSEDWTDFDYNDSFVRVDLTRQVSSDASLSLVRNQTFSVKEGVQSNTVFGYLYSYHENPLTGYAIVNGDENSRFSILFDDGDAILHTTGEINYDEQSRYELAVEVTDSLGNASTGVIFVNVEEVRLTNVDGITFVVDNDYPMSFYDNGQVSNGVLITNTMIDGISYYGEGTREKSQIIFHPNGQVRLAILGQLVTNYTYSVAFGANVGYYSNGNISDGFLIIDQEINGVSYSGDSIISFYPNGQIRFANLAGKQTIGGITYATGENRGRTTFFHDNGQVFSSRLYSNTTIEGWTYSGNTDIVFYDNGQFREGFLAENTLNYQGTFRSNSYITFFENGGIRSGFITDLVTLTLEQTGESILFTGYFERHNLYNGSFYPIRQIMLYESGTFFGVSYTAGQILKFAGYSGYSETYPGGTDTIFSGDFPSFALVNAGDSPEQYLFDTEPNDLYQESVFTILASPPPVTD